MAMRPMAFVMYMTDTIFSHFFFGIVKCNVMADYVTWRPGRQVSPRPEAAGSQS